MTVEINARSHDITVQRFDQVEWEWVNRPWICTIPANMPTGGGFGGEIFGAGSTEADAITNAIEVLGPVALDQRTCGREMIEVLSIFGGDPINWPTPIKWEIDPQEVARLMG